MLLNTIIAFTLVMLTATPSYTATKQKLEACKTVEAVAVYVMGMRKKDYKMGDVFANVKDTLYANAW